jgi:hypothetical protein
MTNRLDVTREAVAASEKQLAELQTAIAAERAARPESVSLASPPPPTVPTHTHLRSRLMDAGSTYYGTSTTRHSKENASYPAGGTRSARRMRPRQG